MGFKKNTEKIKAYILGTYVIRGFLIKIIKYVVRKNNTTYVARLAAKYAQNT